MSAKIPMIVLLGTLLPDCSSAPEEPEKVPNNRRYFMQAARYAHGRVRLEAIVAASWMDNAKGAHIALEALKLPLDRWM